MEDQYRMRVKVKQPSVQTGHIRTALAGSERSIAAQAQIQEFDLVSREYESSPRTMIPKAPRPANETPNMTAGKKLFSINPPLWQAQDWQRQRYRNAIVSPKY
jgi:hypothetical protein